jgi:uroporphyrin-III C-methyltransferase/precorrin-2 dehydrogenase/sirohydrochlorin ferrochelatase
MSEPVGHPVFLDLRGEPVVVIGGGAVAERKVAGLLDSGARVTVIAPRVTPGLGARAEQGMIALRLRPYEPGDLAGCRLAYAATDDGEVNRTVRAEARERKVWLNVADQPELCDFTVPAVVRQGDLTVAVSTNGASPALARRIRERLEAELGPEYASALALLRRVRERLKAAGVAPERTGEIFRALAGPELLRLVASGDGAGIDALLARLAGPGVSLERLGVTELAPPRARRAGPPLAPASAGGRVFLLGAGPGDIGLLTLKAKACLEASDVIVYDALVDKRVLDHARPEALLVYAGKREGRHSRPQEEINALLVQHARAGFTVSRLKGGDPFVFGRGGEEALALREAGIPFEVVPGVSAGVAVPAYAGIPVTHRNVSAQVTFVTGHERTGKDASEIRWDALAAAGGTLVFFMGLGNLADIAERLLAHGRSPGTPAAVIQWGTTEYQVTVEGTLSDIAERVREAGLDPPALVVVGEVVALRERLGWCPEPWARPRSGGGSKVVRRQPLTRSNRVGPSTGVASASSASRTSASRSSRSAAGPSAGSPQG